MKKKEKNFVFFCYDEILLSGEAGRQARSTDSGERKNERERKAIGLVWSGLVVAKTDPVIIIVNRSEANQYLKIYK